MHRMNKHGGLHPLHKAVQNPAALHRELTFPLNENQPPHPSHPAILHPQKNTNTLTNFTKMTGRKRKNIDSDRNSGPQKRGKGFGGTPVLTRNVVAALPAKVQEPAYSADRLPPTFSGCSVASTVPTRVIAPLRKYLPRSVFTSRITDTSAVQEVMVKGAPAGGQKYVSSSPANALDLTVGNL